MKPLGKSITKSRGKIILAILLWRYFNSPRCFLWKELGSLTKKIIPVTVRLPNGRGRRGSLAKDEQVKYVSYRQNKE